MKPHPVEWIEVTWDELKETPRLRWIGKDECPLYDNCLDHAANEDWEGWTCFYCSFQREHRKEKPNGI